MPQGLVLLRMAYMRPQLAWYGTAWDYLPALYPLTKTHPPMFLHFFTSSFFFCFFLIDFCSFRERFQCQVNCIDAVTEHTFLCILKTFLEVHNYLSPQTLYKTRYYFAFRLKGKYSIQAVTKHPNSVTANHKSIFF